MDKDSEAHLVLRLPQEDERTLVTAGELSHPTGSIDPCSEDLLAEDRVAE